MQWKRYKSLPAAEKQSEDFYILGLDIGNDSSAIAFYNLASGDAEAIDLSGGYGKPSMPTVMQYITDTREWVFGEYAILNRGVGMEVTLADLISRLGKSDYIDLDRKLVSVESVLALFLKEILSNVKHINPRAEIVGICAAIPVYFSESAQSELLRAFSLAGFERELIRLVPDRECVLAHYCHSIGNSEANFLAGRQEKRVLLLDYGNREVRGGLYHIKPDFVNSELNGIVITSMSSVFDEAIGTAAIDADVSELFESFLIAQKPRVTKQEKEHISAFVYQHKDMLFQKSIRQKPAKLYFNFAYPPFQETLRHEQAEALIRTYRLRFNRFVQDVLEKNLYDAVITPKDVDIVLCVGGGFEMLWAREVVGAVFGAAQVKFYKNAKLATAEGAALVAAQELEVAASPRVHMEDKHQLPCDIGLYDGKSFIPLVERNTFWWQPHPVKHMIVNRAVEGELAFELKIRAVNGDEELLAPINLTELPRRPKGTTRLSFGVNFASNTDLTVEVKDEGFGELFPRVEYARGFSARL